MPVKMNMFLSNGRSLPQKSAPQLNKGNLVSAPVFTAKNTLSGPIIQRVNASQGRGCGCGRK